MKPSHFILPLFIFISFASFGQRDRVAFNEMPVIKAKLIMGAHIYYMYDERNGLNIRDNGWQTEYIIDGVIFDKATFDSLSNNGWDDVCIQEVNTVVGGIPAKYGDVQYTGPYMPNLNYSTTFKTSYSREDTHYMGIPYSQH